MSLDEDDEIDIVDGCSFEMYSSILNSKTWKEGAKTFCSLTEDVGSIGKDNELEGYLLKREPWDELRLFVNPPFSEIKIRDAIKYTDSIVNNVKKKKFYLQFIVPRWKDEDYLPNGIYYPLT